MEKKRENKINLFRILLRAENVLTTTREKNSICFSLLFICFISIGDIFDFTEQWV